MMKKTIAVVLSVLLLVTFSSCGYEKNTHEYREHQELSSSQVVFDSENMLRVSIPEVGLENVFIREASDVELIDKKVYGQVYLLADDRFGADCGLSTQYLAVMYGDKLFVEELSKKEDQGSCSGNIELCDINGDGDKEILLHECVGMTGGAGQYLSRIFDFVDNKTVEIFLSGNGLDNFDTGYSITILKNNKFAISNKYTDYNEEFCLVDRTDEYYKNFWYDENGNPSELEILVDSFYEFHPVDTDEDGVYEIFCRQYVSLIGHSDGIGCAETVLKYNSTTSSFDIISTEFSLGF